MPSITMPRLSDSMVDGTIVTWLRADGDQIEVGEEIVEIETDKAIMPYQAEHAGPLRIVAREGDVVAVGEIIGHVGAANDDESATAGMGGIKSVASPAQSAAVTSAPAAPPASKRIDPTHPGGSNGRIKASPLARRLAAARGIDLATLEGSGPGGRVVKRDVEGAAPTAGTGERVPLTATQATIARRMVEAKATVPDFTVSVSVDMEQAVALRAELNALRPDRRLSLGDLVVKACAGALREHPRVNASFAGDAVALHARVNVGVAVAAPGSLLVPTIYDADAKSIAEIAEETRRLAERARGGRLRPAEMAGATFTVSNLGMFAVSHFTAVINPPQAAILAVGAVEPQVVVHDGGFAARHRMNMTLSADHRVIYGADAAAFLASVRERLEHPLQLVI